MGTQGPDCRPPFLNPFTVRDLTSNLSSKQTMEEQVQGEDPAEPPPPMPSLPGSPTGSSTSNKAQKELSTGSSETPKTAGPPATPVLVEKKSPLGQSQPTMAGQPSTRPSAEEYGYIVTDQK